jgi:Flp pilus assembly protein TadG
MLKLNRHGTRSGVAIIEFTLVFLPLVAFIFLLLDLGWMIYRRGTLQFAVREGCRFAITNQTLALKDSNNKNYGLIDSVKTVVQSRAMGFLGSKPTDPGYASIQVRFYDPTASLTTQLAVPTDCTFTGKSPNWSGNIVEVSVENYSANVLGAILKSATPFSLTARSSDRMEGNPSSGVPNTFNGTCP